MNGPLTTYHIEIALLDGKKRIFNDCISYGNCGSNGFKIETKKGIEIKFFGAYSVEVISMEDYNRYTQD